jgi:glycosyltransferase involved in cell wall biosynthesis
MTDGVEGFLVSDPGETDAMAGHVNRLLDPSVRREMGQAARRLALQHTFSRNCDAIEALYLEAGSRRSRTSRAA